MSEYPEVVFLEGILHQFIGPDASDRYTITRTVDERGVLLRVQIQKPYAARVIGRNGEIAKAIRELLRALGAKYHAFYSLKIEDK